MKSIACAAFAVTLGAIHSIFLQAQTDTHTGRVIAVHSAGVTSVRFSADGATIASADLTGAIEFRRAADWTRMRVLHHGAEVYALAFSPDGKTLASSGGDSVIAIWDVATGKRIRSIREARRSLAVTFSPSGELLVGTEDGIVHFINPARGVERRTLRTDAAVWSLAVSRDGALLATGLPLRVWNYGDLTMRYKPTTLGQLGVAFARDGRRLVSAESTGGAVLWNLGDSLSYVPLRALIDKRANGPRGQESFSVNMPIASVDITGDGTRVVGGSTSGDVYVWTAPVGGNSPPNPDRWSGHTMSVTAIALSPDEQIVVTGSLDRSVRVWSTGEPSRGAASARSPTHHPPAH
jgi:WD40 repeat protein